MSTSPNGVTRPLPGWFEILRQRFGRGEAHMFLLHGNTSDFVYPGWPVTRWLTRQLTGDAKRPGRDVVLSVSLDGIAFQTTAMHRMFEKTLGLALSDDPEIRAAQVDPTAPDDVPLPIYDQQGNVVPDKMLALVIDFLKRAHRKSDEIDEPDVEGGARSAAAIVEHLDLILPAPATGGRDKSSLTADQKHLTQMLEKASIDTALEDARNPFVFLAPSLESVHSDVLDWPGLRKLKLPLPDYERRLAFVNELVELKPELVMELTASDLATLTAGLTLRDIENITLAAGDGPLTREIALAAQKERMDERYGSVLERVETTSGYAALGGNATLKQVTRERIIEPMRSGDPDLLAEVPMGMALYGPPGAGKSAFGAATANEAKMNYIRIKNLKRKWVGDSEQNVELLIEGAEMFEPTFIEIDEIDKAFPPAEAGGDHPVDSAMRKRMQEWMADTRHRGRRFFMVMSNYPERIDPALVRTGRIDIKAPMLPPETAEERADILSKLLDRARVEALTDDQLAQIGEATEGWTGADLEFAVSKAKGTKRIRRITLMEALLDAVVTIVPARNAEIRRQTLAAIDACNDLSLLPERYRTIAIRRAQAVPADDAEPEPETASVRRPSRTSL